MNNNKNTNLNEQAIARSIAVRQKILDFIKKQGSATFGDVHNHIDPNATATKINYHFYILNDMGYIEAMGATKKTGPRSCKLWRALKDVYIYQPHAPKIKARDDEEDSGPISSGYVNGVCKVKMRHVPRLPNRTGKVHIASTMGLL